MEHVITVDLSEDDKLITEPGFNPREGVARGDTVTWVCIGRAQGKGLTVVFQGLINPMPLESKQADRFSLTVSNTVPGGATFAYDIVAPNGQALRWQDSAVNTGKICIPDPPTRG